MLAGRLARLARDVLREYSELGVQTLLQEAQGLAAERGSLQLSAYRQRAQQLRAKAQRIIDESIIEQYPNDLRQFLISSRYRSGMPANIANIITHGFPDDPNLAISSGELNVYIQATNVILSELGALSIASEKFSIEEISIPADNIGIDVGIPRNQYENKAEYVFDKFIEFSKVMSYYVEFSSGSSDPPSLIYISTTDPVTGFAIVASAAWGFLNLYKLILEIAEKQLGLLRTIKELRTSGLADSNFDDKVKEIVSGDLAKAIAGSLEAVPPQVPPERRNEIEVGLSKSVPSILDAVAKGATVNITIESLDRMFLIAEAIPNLPIEDIRNQLKEQKRLELQVKAGSDALGGTVPPLLATDGRADAVTNREISPPT